MVLDKRKYRIGIFTELCLTHVAGIFIDDNDNIYCHALSGEPQDVDY